MKSKVFILLSLAAVFALGIAVSYRRFAGPIQAKPTGWYVSSPEGYFNLKNAQMNEVVQWLQGMPYRKSYLELLEPSPYTFDEWLNRGKKIDCLETRLLSVYDSRYRQLLGDSLFEAFSRYGTASSAEFFKSRLLRQSMSPEQQAECKKMLQAILKDADKYNAIIAELETKGARQ